MKTKVLLVVAALLMAIVSTVAIGSNMGFKISIPLNVGTTYVSIPYYSSYTDATSLRNDIMAAGGTSVQVLYFNGTIWQRWAGGGVGQVNFAVQPGQCYQIIQSAPSISWVVVGSHNPSMVVPLNQGTTYISVPYHTTATSASTLRTEILNTTGVTVQVLKWNGSIWQRYAGGGVGQTDFALTPGLGTQLISPSPVSTWTPAHF